MIGEPRPGNDCVYDRRARVEFLRIIRPYFAQFLCFFLMLLTKCTHNKSCNAFGADDWQCGLEHISCITIIIIRGWFSLGDRSIRVHDFPLFLGGIVKIDDTRQHNSAK